ncbi:DUF6415 family natural product biosynthesis protein [Streptomyces sp. Da 82-17]|uniref:DUF6415 family natural product biosynthesis protein n=1 Tax=Streptomyces sp. Da 82-17 TaxID=3377116 RepID=UPI0038D38917
MLSGLRRSLAADVVSDELYEDLETVLGEHAVRPSPDDRVAITARLRTATGRLVDVVPRLVSPNSDEENAVVDQMASAVVLSAEQPVREAEHGYLVRLACAVLTLLDHLGEAAEV